LKGSFDVSSNLAKVQVILQTMKIYGIILADIGAPDERWNNDELRTIKKIMGSDFEVVKFNN
jgi:hypothetical protein